MWNEQTIHIKFDKEIALAEKSSLFSAIYCVYRNSINYDHAKTASSDK